MFFSLSVFALWQRGRWKAEGLKLNVVARLWCRFWGDGAAWSAPVCSSPAWLIWGSWEGWLNTANGPHKHWEGPAPAFLWCWPILLQGLRENVVGLGEASSITALVCLSAGWLWEERESEGRQKRVPQEGEFKIKAGKDRNERREEENTFPLTEGVFSCRVHERTIFSSCNHTALLPFPIKKSSLFPVFHCLSYDLTVLPSLLPGQLNGRPIGQGGKEVAARALQLNHVWQATNSSPTTPLQMSEESLGK